MDIYLFILVMVTLILFHVATFCVLMAVYNDVNKRFDAMDERFDILEHMIWDLLVFDEDDPDPAAKPDPEAKPELKLVS